MGFQRGNVAQLAFTPAPGEGICKRYSGAPLHRFDYMGIHALFLSYSREISSGSYEMSISFFRILERGRVSNCLRFVLIKGEGFLRACRVAFVGIVYVYLYEEGVDSRRRGGCDYWWWGPFRVSYILVVGWLVVCFLHYGGEIGWESYV